MNECDRLKSDVFQQSANKPSIDISGKRIVKAEQVITKDKAERISVSITMPDFNDIFTNQW